MKTLFFSIGLLHFASHYYHKALEYPFVGDEKDEVVSILRKIIV